MSLTITELITHLEQIRAEHGELECLISHYGESAAQIQSDIYVENITAVSNGIDNPLTLHITTYE